MDKCIVLLFYRATVESIIFYSIPTGFGNLSTKLRSQIQNCIKRAGKIIELLPSSSLQEIFEESVIKQSLKITKDKNHILCKDDELMPSGKRY